MHGTALAMLLSNVRLGVKHVEKERKRNTQRSEVEGKFGEAKNRSHGKEIRAARVQTVDLLSMNE